jgi:FkbM family methyltransferase
MRQLGYDGLIVAFEPLASAHSTLLDNLGRDPNFVAINGAAGAHDGESMMFRSENSVSSSLLPILDRHVAAAPQSRYVSSEPVTISRLDSCDIPGDRLWLKLDVQGGELAVIDGAAQTLRRTRVVQVELSLTPLYDGAPLIEETVARLRAEGYIPVALEGGFSDGATGECLQVEGLFRRSGS